MSGSQGLKLSTGVSARDTSQDVLDRLDLAVVGAKAVFLLVGTNDLLLKIRIADIAKNVAEIVAGISVAAPAAAR
jgi:lysophospholipase L1-like esterase